MKIRRTRWRTCFSGVHAARRRDAKIRQGLQKQSVLRLPAAACLPVCPDAVNRMVGTVIRRRKHSSLGRQHFRHIPVQRLAVRLAVIASGDARLVGDHNEKVARLVEPPQRLRHPGHKAEVLRLMQIIHFLVDGAVPVQKDDLRQLHILPSATSV